LALAVLVLQLLLLAQQVVHQFTEWLWLVAVLEDKTQLKVVPLLVQQL
jgi:hypothetical protein